ncbi:YjbH domain-containing protein [Stenotrophomonas sp. MMGLT7]|uniref:YjbH domain-containing protein n=1 Tax=Stenotrophomonas sp. MMGLT7 TaxID=2901227 RepID=UPI0022B23955|nr:YjbH domain-containing protein [Stenotrophomonas sp. MMGLT7]
MKPHRTVPGLARCTLSLLALATSAAVYAQEGPAPTASDWGNIGLLQTPTARMAEEGEIALTASHTSPYSRYNLTMQPFPWFEGAFRYISVANRRYGAPGLSGDQNYKDKSLDFKVRLWQESRWLPEVALGFRDFGGTGLFASEYLVASKRFGPVDASLGLATGYIGNRGDFSNPLGAIDDKFKQRSSTGRWGDVSFDSMFRGRVGVFGGIAYQTPWDRLQLKLEYDGNDYKNEPQNNNQEQDSPFNLGAVFTVNRNIVLSAGWERGNTAMFALTLRSNPARSPAMAKLLDPKPEPLRARDASAAGTSATIDAGAQHGIQGGMATTAGRDDAQPGTDATDWQDVATRLRRNAGFQVRQISRRGPELVVDGQQLRYFHPAQGLGRSARILDNSVDPDIEWFTLLNTRLGMPISETSIKRDTFVDYLEHRTDLQQLKLATELNPPTQQQREVLYQAPIKRFGGGFNIGYKQNLGGPDGFILYQIAANYTGSYFFTRNLWLTGTVSGNLVNNYDKFKYDAPSNMPRVRTDLRQYMTTSDITVPNLQLTTAGKLGRDLYGIAYAGYLEWMYAGAGGELLYRPMGERWALGINANWVRQRDYDQHFGLRDYDIATGHATFYYAFGREQRVLASLSAGRYLAGDWGATLDVARVFRNGVTMGAYATKTNVSAEEFGEGSFDKGIYFTIPFDSMLPRSNRSRATFVWNPLIRDGGAMLGRKYALYPLTSDRNEWFFYENLDKIDR